MKKKLKMLLTRNENEQFEVVVMAISDGYAMVRRPGCVPFVAAVTSLGPIIE